MIFLILTIIFGSSLLLSKYIFKRIFNPLSVYASIWFFLLILYEIRLINYDIISFQVWIVIGGSYLAFIIGILIPYIFYGPVELNKKDASIELMNRLLSEKEGQIKLLIIIFSFLGLFGAIQHWTILLKMYGSVGEVLLHLTKIYKMRISGEIEGVLPYISVTSYVAIFLVAVYSAFKKKFSLLTIIPFVSIVMKGIAAVGRQGILYGFLEFITTYIVARYYFSGFSTKTSKSNKGIVITLSIFFTLLIASVILIRDFRGNDETYIGETRQLKTLKGGLFITPSIYLYLSAHVGVLNKYYEMGIEQSRIGENTFQLVYNTLAKFNFTEPARIYQKAYFIPEWTNTGTYLREIDADFGTIGVFLVPFLLGIFSFYNWAFFFKRGNPIYLIFLVHLFLIIWFSFLMMITRGANWFLSIALLYFIFNALKFSGEILTQKNSNLSLQK